MAAHTWRRVGPRPDDKTWGKIRSLVLLAVANRALFGESGEGSIPRISRVEVKFRPASGALFHLDRNIADAVEGSINTGSNPIFEKAVSAVLEGVREAAPHWLIIDGVAP